MPTDALSIPNLRDRVSAQEWRQRIDLAAAYRLVALFGWDDLVFTHISARVPGQAGEFLINPYGLMFEEITASSLVKVDPLGNKVDDSPFDVNPAGFVIHSAIHAARDDAHCVLHVHTPNGIAVSAQKGGVLPLSQQSIFVLSSLGYHDYEGVALRDDEKPRLVRDLGDHNFLMLRNHGLLTLGAGVAGRLLGHVPVRDRVHDPGSRPGWRRGVGPCGARHHRHRAGPGGAGHPWPRRGADLARLAAPARPPPARLRPLSRYVSGLEAGRTFF